MPRKFAEQLAKGEGKLSGGAEAWITAADDLAGINTVEGAAKRLTLVDEAGNLRLQGDAVVEFEFEDMSGIASPYNRLNPGFVKGNDATIFEQRCLQEVKVDAYNWKTLYKCKGCSTCWEETYVEGRFGGTPELRKVDKSYVVSAWGSDYI